MRNKDMMFSLAAVLFATASFAQGVEYDDMYFNSKDRAALNAQRTSTDASAYASNKKVKKNEIQEEVFVNPTDSYSARNVNPEFSSRSNSQTALADEQDYFVSNYRYKQASDINSWNNSFNNWYGVPLYRPNYYGSSIYAWNSPYYGSYYDPYGYPYYQSGWSSSYSFYMGNSWNYGWGGGMGMGMGMGYGNPYGNSWGSYGYGYGGYPVSIVYINNYNNGGYYGEAGKPVAYGKRPTRSGMVTTPQETTNYRTRTNYVAASSGDRPSNTGGRVSTPSNGTQQVEYYNRSWRNSQQGQSAAYPTRNSANSSWGNSTYDRSSNGDSYNRSSGSNSYSSPSRSSSVDSGGGATRSSAPASSGSGGRSRGRD